MPQLGKYSQLGAPQLEPECRMRNPAYRVKNVSTDSKKYPYKYWQWGTVIPLFFQKSSSYTDIPYRPLYTIIRVGGKCLALPVCFIALLGRYVDQNSKCLVVISLCCTE